MNCIACNDQASSENISASRSTCLKQRYFGHACFQLCLSETALSWTRLLPAIPVWSNVILDKSASSRACLKRRYFGKTPASRSACLKLRYRGHTCFELCLSETASSWTNTCVQIWLSETALSWTCLRQDLHVRNIVILDTPTYRSDSLKQRYLGHACVQICLSETLLFWTRLHTDLPAWNSVFLDTLVISSIMLRWSWQNGSNSEWQSY
jgi:hypothetical protein